MIAQKQIFVPRATTLGQGDRQLTCEGKLWQLSGFYVLVRAHHERPGGHPYQSLSLMMGRS